ncbi:peptide deformylase [Candidatus Microgenomates bacterium]|nr:peptide deformylase [Candidatus Microgenomates bacterium]
MLKIITVPNKILNTPSKPITKIDKRVKKLAKEMITFLKTGADGKSLGVGLSTVQIGKPLRLFIAYSPQSRHYLTFINPKIIWQSKKKILGIPERKEFPYEGCLSIPNTWGKVWRHEKIKASYQNLRGIQVTKEFSGFLGTIIQHEYDHLNGILFVQRVLEEKNKLYKIEKDEEGKESLIEIRL